MDPRYIAGVIDGDGSINMSMVGPLGKQGYLLKVEITQCDIKYLECMNAALGGQGKLYTDVRNVKYKHEAAHTLRFCGKKGKEVLKIVANHGIMKVAQAKLALEFLEIPRMGHKQEKEACRLKMRELNADKSYPKKFERLNDAYIAGIYDAEGDVRCESKDGKVRRRVRITQQSDPQLASKLVEYFGYGTVRDTFRFVIEKTSFIMDFARKIGVFSAYPRRMKQMQKLLNMENRRVRLTTDV